MDKLHPAVRGRPGAGLPAGVHAEAIVTAAFVVLMLALVPVVALVYGREELVAPGLVVIAGPGRRRAPDAAVGLLPADGLRPPAQAAGGRARRRVRRHRRAGRRRRRLLEPGGRRAPPARWPPRGGADAPRPTGSRCASSAARLRDYVTFSWPLFVAAASSLVIAQGSILVGEKRARASPVRASIALAATISQLRQPRRRDRHRRPCTPRSAPCADRTDLLFESFVKSNRLALMWGMPFGIGLALFASDLVEFGIGERWRAGGRPASRPSASSRRSTTSASTGTPSSARAAIPGRSRSGASCAW